MSVHRKSLLKLWPRNVLPLRCHWESQAISLLLPPLTVSPFFLPNWLPMWTTSCRTKNSDYKALFLEEAGGCTVCQAELSKEGSGSIWVDYLLFSFPPLLSLSVFLYARHLLFSLTPFSDSLSLSSSLVCQDDGWKASPWQIVKSYSLSYMKKPKCLSQLLAWKGFGEQWAARTQMD